MRKKTILIFILLFVGFQNLYQKSPLLPHKADLYLNNSNLQSDENTPISIGTRLELFVDDFLIDHLLGETRLKLHHPEPKGVAIIHDALWEGTGSGYHSIFKDGDKFRMYYKAWEVKAGKLADHNKVYCCYAESDDGVIWNKPNLGLYEFQGSKHNNIVFINGVMDGVNADGGHPAVFLDENPNVSADAKYKAVLVAWEQTSKGLVVFKSPDGINWSALQNKTVITDGAFDSQNVAFWDAFRGEYRAYWRTVEKIKVETREQTNKKDSLEPFRGIRTAISSDMIHWHDYKDLKYMDSIPDQLYTNVIKPYYRAPHVFVGFPARYVDRGWTESIDVLPDLEERQSRSFKDKDSNLRYGTAITDALFMVSRDGLSFKRWNEAFLRPGIERKGTWNYGHQYIAWSILETKSSLENAPNELSLYATENYWMPPGSALRRYTLRIDGFVSVNATRSGGELITKPLIFDGNRLTINFSSSAAGEIRVEIQDKTGTPIPGFTLDDCPPIFGDSLEREIVWGNEKCLSELNNKAVRLRFVLKDCDLYSIQFKL